jgi:hypothetical protein
MGRCWQFLPRDVAGWLDNCDVFLTTTLAGFTGDLTGDAPSGKGVYSGSGYSNC